MDRTLQTADFCDAVSSKLSSIPPGATSATAYHRLIGGVLTFIFNPSLVSPKLEQPIHGGRKRIDIVYTNFATEGFFFTIKTAPQTRARFVVVECKNYSEDLSNPEFDQLTGRFGHSRGQFGIICCRKNSNKAALIARSKDAANDGRGVVIVLDDQDILNLLNLIASGNRQRISTYVEQKYREIVF